MRSGGDACTPSPLTLENATDAVYRNHLNRVKEILPEPGRNLRLLHKIFF